jgi:hypothetical protein
MGGLQHQSSLRGYIKLYMRSVEKQCIYVKAKALQRNFRRVVQLRTFFLGGLLKLPPESYTRMVVKRISGFRNNILFYFIFIKGKVHELLTIPRKISLQAMILCFTSSHFSSEQSSQFLNVFKQSTIIKGKIKIMYA